MSLDYEIIGKKLKATRETKNITPQELAKKIELTVSEIVEIEKGNIKINLKQLFDLCNILNISVYEVINTTDNKIRPFMDKELYELIIKCDYKKQRLIYNMVKLIVKTEFA